MRACSSRGRPNRNTRCRTGAGARARSLTCGVSEVSEVADSQLRQVNPSMSHPRQVDSELIRKVVAEFMGTAILVFFAVGSAVFGIDKVGNVGVAFAFGLV